MQSESNKKLTLKLLGLSALMGVFAFAMVPLYNVLCEITGLNGGVVDQALYQEEEIDKSRLVTVEFITEINRGMPWKFKSQSRKVQVHPGELNEVMFYAKNFSTQPITGRAVPSITPAEASFYVNKTECFCFDQQVLKAGEEVDMPMKFFIDADMPEHIRTITMSYVLFNAGSDSVQTVADK